MPSSSSLLSLSHSYLFYLHWPLFVLADGDQQPWWPAKSRDQLAQDTHHPWHPCRAVRAAPFLAGNGWGHPQRPGPFIIRAAVFPYYFFFCMGTHDRYIHEQKQPYYFLGYTTGPPSRLDKQTSEPMGPEKGAVCEEGKQTARGRLALITINGFGRQMYVWDIECEISQRCRLPARHVRHWARMTLVGYRRGASCPPPSSLPPPPSEPCPASPRLMELGSCCPEGSQLGQFMQTLRCKARCSRRSAELELGPRKSLRGSTNHVCGQQCRGLANWQSASRRVESGTSRRQCDSMPLGCPNCCILLADRAKGAAAYALENGIDIVGAEFRDYITRPFLIEARGISGNRLALLHSCVTPANTVRSVHELISATCRDSLLRCCREET